MVVWITVSVIQESKSLVLKRVILSIGLLISHYQLAQELGLPSPFPLFPPVLFGFHGSCFLSFILGVSSVITR